MAERTCRECAFVSYSQVAVDCPNCGKRLPRLIAGAGFAKAVRVLLFVIAVTGGASWLKPYWQEALSTVATLLPASPAPAHTDATPVLPPAGQRPSAGVSPETASPDTWKFADHGAARKALASDVPAQRAAAAEWLGLHGTVRDAAPLLERGRDEDGDVRWRVMEALGRVLANPAARAAAPQQAKAAVTLMIGGLKDPELTNRFTAASGLAAMDAREATEALLEVLEQGSVGAIGAAAALGTLREPRAVAPLLKLLDDEQTRWHAAQALGEIGGPAAEGVLLDALRRKNYPIMAGAHEFYMQRGGPGMETSLLDLLQQSGDLAVAQTFIVKGSPALAKAARTWASEHGYKLVKKDDGYFWEQPEAPQ